MAIDAKQRQASSRQARAAAGGKLVTVMLQPKAAAKLARWLASGATIAGTVNRLLEQSTPPRAARLAHHAEGEGK